MSTDTTPTYDLSAEDAEMLAQHAIHVQGGFSTPEREAERFAADVARGLDPEPALDKMRDEVRATLLAKLAALPDTEPPAPAPEPAEAPEAPEPSGPQRVEVTAAMPDIDAAVGLRARIKAMKAVLKAHEDAVRDVLGGATEGVDSTGNVVVRQPTRNRTNLVAAKVKAILSDEEYASCQNTTSYKPLLFSGDE